jgi:hypothetical protein
MSYCNDADRTVKFCIAAVLSKRSYRTAFHSTLRVNLTQDGSRIDVNLRNVSYIDLYMNNEEYYVEENYF